MSVVRFAQSADVPAMSAIWANAFGDSAEYISFFMNERLPSSAALVLEERGVVKSQLFLLPGNMSVSGAVVPSLYLYAAATERDSRGRGFMALLIEAAKEYAADGGFHYITLVPSGGGLYGYYSRFDFHGAFGYRLLSFRRAELENLSDGTAKNHILTAFEMSEIRNKGLSGFDAFIWDENAVSFASEQHALSGGKIICAPRAWALSYEENGAENIIELCAESSAAFAALAARLLDKCGAETFKFKVPDGFFLKGGEYFRGGMIFKAPAAERSKSIRRAYMGLIME